MVEYDNVRECLNDLYSLVDGSVTNTDGTPISKNDFIGLVAERLYNLMDLLGHSDIYLE
ncbi:hypothetical protein [Vagococcus carniphilus]|uniref:hypothetical protein n=1 Tax=Vagococcus carniphilus TaxID=218144 RepID=UPI00288E3C38|nr:hypothetical protein [Vagococcus carniphilus]MDT2866486.1 hypothetical protein [Vagococcus carniphilus]